MIQIGDQLRAELQRELLDEAAIGFLPQPHWAKNMETRLKIHMVDAAVASTSWIVQAVEVSHDDLLQQLQQVVDAAVVSIVAQLSDSPSPTNGPAVRAILTITIGANPMTTTTITVDTTNATAGFVFVDDKGNTNATPPAGAIAAFTSDNPAALTIANDATNPMQGDITVVGEGVANVGATLTDAAGNPLLEADGVTPWAPIGSVAVTVNPGAPVGAQLSVAP